LDVDEHETDKDTSKLNQTTAEVLYLFQWSFFAQFNASSRWFGNCHSKLHIQTNGL